MTMNDVYMNEAEVCALSSTHPRFHVGAVLVLRNGRRYFGFNQTRTHPLQFRFWSGKPRLSTHAEVHALVVALRHHPRSEVRGSTLYVARPNRLMARPCESCQRAIRAFGVQTVYYTQAGAWTGPHSVLHLSCEKY